MREMDVKQLIALLLKKWWIIVIAVLICGMAGYLISTFVIEEKYESSSLLYISSNKNSTNQENLTYNEYNLNIKLVNSYTELCKTDMILNKVLDETGLYFKLEDLSEMINVSSINNTELIKITVKNENPEVAATLANAIAMVFTREIPNIIKMDNVQIIDYAIVSIEPVEPDILMYTLVATLIGLMLTIIAILMVNYFDISIKEREQLEQVVGIPVFGVIPRIKNKDHMYTIQNMAEFSKVKEAFVRLVHNIDFLNIDNAKSICLAITSPTTGEGKSTVISNLAISLARNNKRVLLIDADMRRPMINKLFNITNTIGLSTILSTDFRWENYVFNTDIENLSIIVSGKQPPNPAMLLTSKKMKQIVYEAKKEYDYVLIDTPPILLVSDVLGLCTNIDYLLLVAKCKYTTEPNIIRAKEDLLQVDSPLSGTILNEYIIKSNNVNYYDNYESKRPNAKRKK